MDKEFSSLLKTKRVMAYALRFLRRCIAKVSVKDRITKSLPFLKSHRIQTNLQGYELKQAHNVLVKDFQRATITEELNLQLDSAGVLRCYGRLNRAKLNEDEKNPIFITPKTPFAFLIIRDIHAKHHKGTAHTMATVRDRYWIPQLRRQVRGVIKRCIPCQKMNNLSYKYPKMTNLPSRRVIRSRPFEHVGLDYFGPLTVTSRNLNDNKVYGCILTCTTTRLIHLEVVTDMTTESFINALRRFIARRGVPSTITSDNANTFTLAEQILTDVTRNIRKDSTVHHLMSENEITWYYNTPYAPWQGGFYERLIKIVKHSLYKTLGRKVVNLDQLTTTLSEIESCLNTRPLTYQEES
uniref:Integrase catalytic domain-containing protein n=1 Tax=Heterorhabditis bacteriophora TaxID=37862 RepID=A0A1I7WA91_HETBA